MRPTVHNCVTTIPSLPLFIPYSLFTVAILLWEEAMAHLMITSNGPTNCVLVTIQTPLPNIDMVRCHCGKEEGRSFQGSATYVPSTDELTFILCLLGKVYKEKENQNCKIQKPCQSH